MEDLSHEQTFNQVTMIWDGGWSVSPSQPVNMSAALVASSKMEDLRASLGAANDALLTSSTMESSIGISPSWAALAAEIWVEPPSERRARLRFKGSCFLDGKPPSTKDLRITGKTMSEISEEGAIRWTSPDREGEEPCWLEPMAPWCAQEDQTPQLPFWTIEDETPDHVDRAGLMEFAAICEDTILEFHVFPCGDFQRGFCAKHGARGKAHQCRNYHFESQRRRRAIDPITGQLTYWDTPCPSWSLEMGCSLAGDSCPLAHGREEVGMGVVVGKLEHLANRGVLSPGQIQD
eukprot:g32464.t1